MTNQAWGQQNEIRWLKKIGTHVGDDCNFYPKKEYLIGYIKGIKKRVNLGGINRNKCIAYAQAMLLDIEYSNLTRGK